jgi:RimJ/RimL family protein N-acetyltransferase
MDSHQLPRETDRLIVRRFEERDIPDILDYSRHEEDDQHRRFNIGWEFTEESVRKWWEPMMTMTVDEATNWLALVIEVKELGRVVGNTGFSTKKNEEQRQAMIGWTLGKAFEGNGYVTEAATALLDYLFLAEGFHRAYAMTSLDNPRSWRLMERLGMRREAHFVKNCYHDGVWVDEYVYAILAEEWKAKRNG